MKRPGLTEAMRRALLDPSSASRRMCERLADEGLLFLFAFHREASPRGQAALAAPRMTAAELALLVYLEGSSYVSEKLYAPTWRSCERKGWIDYNNEYECWDPTKAGLTALNNMRAAMGSAEYKEIV